MSSIIIKDATIVTMNHKILGADILIKDDKIKKIEKNIEDRADKIINANGMLVMPGFVNCHTHVAMSLFRGYADELELMDWLQKAIWPMEEKLSEEDVYIASKLSFIEMIKSGTTCFNDMYFFEEAVCKAADEVGIRGMVSRNIMGNDEYAEKRLKQAEKLYNSWNDKSNGKIKVCVGLHAPYTCPPKLLKKGVALAKKLNVPIHMHYLETKDEINEIKQRYNMTVTEYLKSNRVFDVKTILAHGVWADEYDVTELQFHDVSIVNCPISNCKLGSGIGDMKFILDNGINVALGTDGQGSCNTLDMFEELKTCAYSQKVLYKSASALSAEKALEMATIKGAKALDMARDIGTIEVGKKADIIIVDVDKSHLTPMNNIYSTLVYSCNGSDVVTTIIDGKVVMENRKILTCDEDDVLNGVREHALKLFN